MRVVLFRRGILLLRNGWHRSRLPQLWISGREGNSRRRSVDT
jgi:hypothetical protein